MNLDDAIRGAFEENIAEADAQRARVPCPVPERWVDVRIGLANWTRAELDHISGCERCTRTHNDLGSEDAEALKEPVSGEYQPAELGVTQANDRPDRSRGHTKLKRVLTLAATLFIGALIPVAIAGTAYGTLIWPDRSAWNSLIGLFADDTQPAVTVIANNRVLLPVTHEPVSDRVGVGDAIALGAWQSTLSQRGGNPGLALSSEQVKESIARGETLPSGPMCIIGGPSGSELALEYMARLRLPNETDANDLEALKRGFRFELEPQGRGSAFARPGKASGNGQTPELGIRDVETGELAPVQRAATNPYDPDAALVMLGKLDGRPVLIVAGYESRGTAAAMNWLLRPSPGVTAFYRIYRDQEYAEAVIRTRPQSNEPELFQFRSVKNPRGRT